MKKHILEVHERKKTFECDVCGSRFARKDHLKGHIAAVHEGAKPFKCEFCDVSCSQKPQILKRSMKERNHTNVICVILISILTVF